MLDSIGRWALPLWAAGLVFGTAFCVGGGTPCDEAVDKAVGECGLGDGFKLPIGGDGNSECVDEPGLRIECGAECVNEADCDDLVDEEGDTDYHQCVQDCQM